MSFLLVSIGVGTTSACAENTGSFDPITMGHVNYLRVRGAYEKSRERRRSWTELPPRARRIRHKLSPFLPNPGTTSACAENTLNELGLL